MLLIDLGRPSEKKYGNLKSHTGVGGEEIKVNIEEFTDRTIIRLSKRWNQKCERILKVGRH